MSYGIMPYKIRLEALNQVIEDRDATLAAWLRSRCGFDLDSIDEDLGTERPTGEYLTDLLLGRPFVDAEPHLYGYSVKALIELFGAMLPNHHWSAMRYGWFDTVTAAVAGAGVQFSFADLVMGGPGVDIPMPDDFPLMGHRTRAELQEDLARLEPLDLTAIEDRYAVDAVRQVQGWLRECLRDDMDLVCYYH